MTIATDIHADLLTPLGAYLRLRREDAGAFLLESVEKGRLGRYSLVGSGSRLVSFAEAERALAEGAPVVGYLGYDHVAELEPTVPLPAEGPELPESRFVIADTLVRFDHVTNVAEVLAGDRDELEALFLSDMARALTPGHVRIGHQATRRFPSQKEYEAGVRQAKEHIRAGDAYQIVLSQRAERPTDVSALSLYRALRRINPSPYHFLLELGEVALVGSSPETLVRLDGTRASVNPIAGTTASGDGDAAHLLASAKDRAEHIMLVDLGRNDLSRVCRPGTVRVGRFLEPERYSHVTHLVSEVAGELLPEFSAFDLLRACFPAGTVSGAPKPRAMEIIESLEPTRRALYAGTVGYVDASGDMDMAIAIRTAVLHQGRAYVQAGAGIVADSDPATEEAETRHKARAVLSAIATAEGLRELR
jgi:anthranilate synthase component 1